jgi:hypothetical protein
MIYNGQENILPMKNKNKNKKNNLKRARIRLCKRKIDSLSTNINSQFAQNNIGNYDKDTIIRTGKWDSEEHNIFLKACLTYGNNWIKVSIFLNFPFFILFIFLNKIFY